MQELETLASVLKQHPDWGRGKIANHLGWSENKVSWWKNKLHALDENSIPKPVGPKQGITQEFSQHTGNLTSLSTRIKTLDDLLRETAVDQNLWKVSRHELNKWEIGAKNDDGEIIVEPLWQVKAWLVPRIEYIESKKWIHALIAELKSVAPRLAPVKYAKHKDGHLLEVSIFDLHLGKLCWSEETNGDNYDIKITESLFKEGLECLLARSASFPVSEILFPVGNDFYNVDNSAGTTTGGTPQDEDGRWQKTFMVGKRMMIEAILRLRQVAPVKVVMVAGNHDTERLFYLGEVLQSYFHATPGVTIHNSPALRKYFAWGKCLIGFTHGKEEKHNQLPLIMATEEPKLWAASKHREMHLGHWHQKKDMFFNAVGEHSSVRVRVLPSLSPPDAWHTSKGYKQLRSAEAYLWHPDDGCVGYLTFNP